LVVDTPVAQPITIPLSFVELLIHYQRPNVKAFNDRAGILQAIFDALLPWSPRFDDVEPVTTGKLSEQGFSFRLPPKQISLFFGPVFCRLSRDNVDWNEAEETIAIFGAALSGLTNSTGIEMGVKTATVGVHLQPKDGTFMDILSPFAPPQIMAIEEQTPRTMASVLKWEKRRITLDGSGSLANAAFLKFEREFPAVTTFPEIAKQIFEDEQQLFSILGVEEVRE
jgi:hypothetical protein